MYVDLHIATSPKFIIHWLSLNNHSVIQFNMQPQAQITVYALNVNIMLNKTSDCACIIYTVIPFTGRTTLVGARFSAIFRRFPRKHVPKVFPRSIFINLISIGDKNIVVFGFKSRINVSFYKQTERVGLFA